MLWHQRTLDWVGNAWGGHVGVTFATTSPARCRTLVTQGTPVQAYRAPERVQALLLLLLYRLLGPVRFIQNGVVDTMLSPRTRAEDPAAVRRVRDCLVHADRAKLSNAVVSISLRRPDLSQFLRRVSAPTLFITGTDHVHHRHRPPGLDSCASRSLQRAPSRRVSSSRA
jgi:pimeloyl-ACP methyl ester carboxylesterase